MAASTRDERIALLEKSANALGAMAWLVAIVGIIGGSVAANAAQGSSSTAALFVTTSGSYVLAAAGFMVARAVTLLVLAHTVDD